MILVIVGIAVVLAGLTARKFSAGLSFRVPISSWQGRTWMLITGGLLIAMGLAEKFPSARIWTTIFAFLESGYEIFMGLILLLVGGGFAIFGKKVDKRTRLLFGAGGVIGGLVLISDGIQKL
jgi:hypothetical protein